MQEDYQQQLAFSQENQFNDYQDDYYSEKDENYYDQLKEIKTLIETHEKAINKQLKETKNIEKIYRELINEQKKYDKKILEIMGIFLSIFSVIGLGVSSLSKLKSNYFSTWSMICGTILITISGLFYLINFNEKVEKKTLKILIPSIIGLILIIIGVVCRKFLNIAIYE